MYTEAQCVTKMCDKVVPLFKCLFHIQGEERNISEKGIWIGPPLFEIQLSITMSKHSQKVEDDVHQALKAAIKNVNV